MSATKYNSRELGIIMLLSNELHYLLEANGREIGALAATDVGEWAYRQIRAAIAAERQANLAIIQRLIGVHQRALDDETVSDLRIVGQSRYAIRQLTYALNAIRAREEVVR